MGPVEWTRLEGGQVEALVAMFVNREHPTSVRITPSRGDGGADILVPHMGLTTSGTIGAQTALTLEEVATRVQALADAAKRVNPDILCLCHGGPIAEPDDAAYVMENTDGVVGFFGASSIERLPTERGITDQVHRFKDIGRAS